MGSSCASISPCYASFLGKGRQQPPLLVSWARGSQENTKTPAGGTGALGIEIGLVTERMRLLVGVDPGALFLGHRGLQLIREHLDAYPLVSGLETLDADAVGGVGFGSEPRQAVE